MSTDALRALTAAGARTILGAQLWPNGLGFDTGALQFCYDERAHAWHVAYGDHCGHGPSPTAALDDLK